MNKDPLFESKIPSLYKSKNLSFALNASFNTKEKCEEEFNYTELFPENDFDFDWISSSLFKETRFAFDFYEDVVDDQTYLELAIDTCDEFFI